MDGLPIELIQYPIAGVVIITVVIFLRFIDKFLRERDTWMASHEESRMKQLEKIGENCHTHHEQTIASVAGIVEKNNTVIESNSGVIRENSKAAGQVIEALRQINGRHKRKGR